MFLVRYLPHSVLDSELIRGNLGKSTKSFSREIISEGFLFTDIEFYVIRGGCMSSHIEVKHPQTVMIHSWTALDNGTLVRRCDGTLASDGCKKVSQKCQLTGVKRLNRNLDFSKDSVLRTQPLELPVLVPSPAKLGGMGWTVSAVL